MVEQSLDKLWTVCIWYFGISATITVGLFGWLTNLNSRASVRESIRSDLDRIVVDVQAIKEALIGGYDKKGLVTKVYELDVRLKELEAMGGRP